MDKLFLVLAALPEVPDEWAGEDAIGFVPEEADEQYPAIAAMCVADSAATAVDMITEYAETDYGLTPVNCVVRDLAPYRDELVDRELEGNAEAGTLLDIGLRLLVGGDEETQSSALQYAFDVLMNPGEEEDEFEDDIGFADDEGPVDEEK